ncbi:MAG: type II and III secretion system protein [Planctomycetes bacterium]|nr:type II and III secretion system protein [Planctomycetota bacterium]
MPVVLQDLAREANCSIVWDAALEGQVVSLNIVDMPVPEALAVIARRLGVDMSRAGRLFYVGKLRPQDRGYLVRRVRALTSEELTGVIDAVKSQDGQSRVLSAGVVVISDRVEVLQRITSMLDEAERASSQSAQWCVQLYLISASDAFLSDLGVDAAPAIDLAATYALASNAAAVSAANLNFGLNAVLHAARSSENGSVVAEPLLLLRDGSTADFSRGQRVPIAQKTVSDQGTVTTTGYEFLQTGLVIHASVREVTPVRCALTVSVTLSAVDSISDDGLPLTSQAALEGTQEVESGGVYLLGALEQADKSAGQTGFLRWGASSQERHNRFQLWCRVMRVSGGAAREATQRSKEPTEQATQVPKSQVSQVERGDDRATGAILEMPFWQSSPIPGESESEPWIATFLGKDTTR